jgi:hypothetical protein
MVLGTTVLRTPDDDSLLIDSGASVSVINKTLKLHEVKSFTREILSSINRTTLVTKSGNAKFDLIDMEDEHFTFQFEAKCAPEADLPGAGILSCTVSCTVNPKCTSS